MVMNLKYFSAGIFALFVIIGWNAFLIQRDDKLFKAYYRQKAQIEAQNLTPKEQWCKQQAGWHPDCNLE
jgi:hypothetical protein